METLVKGHLYQSPQGLSIKVTSSAVPSIKKEDSLQFKPTGKLKELLEDAVKLSCITIVVAVEGNSS